LSLWTYRSLNNTAERQEFSNAANVSLVVQAFHWSKKPVSFSEILVLVFSTVFFSVLSILIKRQSSSRHHFVCVSTRNDVTVDGVCNVMLETETQMCEITLNTYILSKTTHS